MLGRWLLHSDRQHWRKHGSAGRTARPRGRCGDGLREACGEHRSQDQSSPPTPSQGAGGLPDLFQALHQAQPPAGAGGTGRSPPGWGTPNLHIGTSLYPNTARPQPLSEAPWARGETRRGPCSRAGPTCPLGHGTALGTKLLLMPAPRSTILTARHPTFPNTQVLPDMKLSPCQGRGARIHPALPRTNPPVPGGTCPGGVAPRRLLLPRHTREVSSAVQPRRAGPTAWEQ